ncbi:hypothetical protein HMPREF9073_01664 [Capnocytophaga sp. oral taxon 326 str. F0382]|nr:hypothetical protein HMPREF9073_01664 [Capnocytophaga sp. oral taxon 326 str. F0382]
MKLLENSPRTPEGGQVEKENVYIMFHVEHFSINNSQLRIVN